MLFNGFILESDCTRQMHSALIDYSLRFLFFSYTMRDLQTLVGLNQDVIFGRDKQVAWQPPIVAGEKKIVDKADPNYQVGLLKVYFVIFGRISPMRIFLVISPLGAS